MQCVITGVSVRLGPEHPPVRDLDTRAGSPQLTGCLFLGPAVTSSTLDEPADVKLQALGDLVSVEPASACAVMGNTGKSTCRQDVSGLE